MNKYRYLPSIAVLLALALSSQLFALEVLWDRSGAGDNAWYGVGVFGLGDQNDDGNDDFMVWALGQGEPGQENEGVLELFHGGNPPATMPYLRFTGDAENSRELLFGWVVGDINGDDYQDWGVWMESGTSPNSYAVQLFWGGPDADATPDFTLSLPYSQDYFPLGDFNGDSYDDMYRYHEEPDDYLEILYSGNPMDTIPDWIMHSSPGHRYQALPESFGDVNGDGYSDFISDTPIPERITYIFLGGEDPDTLPAYTWEDFYHGSKEIVQDLNGDHRDELVFSETGGRFSVHLGGDMLSPTPDYTLNFDPECSAFYITSVGDINNDGYNDAVVVDDFCNNGWGTLSLYLGHPWLNPDPVLTIEGRTSPLNLIGIRTAAGLGDVNGDGVDDWAIGAANTNFDGRRGRVVVISGDTTLRVGVDNPFIPQPLTFNLSNYPNPFNASTTLQIDLPLYTTDVTLRIYNLLGQVVHEAHLRPTGTQIRYAYDGTSDGIPLASGIYIAQVTSGSLHETAKLVVMR